MIQSSEWYVYIIEDVGETLPGRRRAESRRWYTGISNNWPERITEHNTGKSKYTRGGSWVLRCLFTKLNRQQAAMLERWLKTGNTKQKREQCFIYRKPSPSTMPHVPKTGEPIGIHGGYFVTRVLIPRRTMQRLYSRMGKNLTIETGESW